MAFPLTHLLVADAILTSHPRHETEEALFMLGSIAPDAIHHRKEFTGAEMKNIGAAKKVTHLCPISDERWGMTTDNIGWAKCVKRFLHGNTGPFAEGYAIHVLTDIYTNMTIWERVRTQYPEETAKGYESGYYRDLKDIDVRLYHSLVKGSRIERLLAQAKACDMPGLVSEEEVCAIRDNILYVHCKDRLPIPGYKYTYVSYGETLDFIREAAGFTVGVLIDVYGEIRRCRTYRRRKE